MQKLLEFGRSKFGILLFAALFAAIGLIFLELSSAASTFRFKRVYQEWDPIEKELNIASSQAWHFHDNHKDQLKNGFEVKMKPLKTTNDSLFLAAHWILKIKPGAI